MCGIVGFINPNSGSGPGEDLRASVSRMTRALVHRGPDDDQHWIDADTGMTLGFRRLSILDLSVDGRQPMLSPCGRFAIVFNGEIYNHLQIRALLEKKNPEALAGVRGHSDTAILLAAARAWGIEATLEYLVGMFAFALWDRLEQTLTLARDRAGEKPLYFGWNGGTFLFASELKALRAHPRWKGEIDPEAFRLFAHLNYVPTPHSIYRGIAKLTAGTYVKLSLAQLVGGGGTLPTPVAYWHAGKRQDPLPERDCVSELEKALEEAVRLQMVADVPVGAFLSGGIDSGTIVALMAKHSAGRVKTFTIGYSEEQYNEAGYARAVAKHLGTEHHELIVTPAMARDVIPRLPHIYDEPFADSSQIPTFLISQLARAHVTVSLSGDGGDELFGGYTRYEYASSLWNKFSRLPQPLRSTSAQFLSLLPSSFSPKLQKLSRALASPDLNTLYGLMMTNVPDPDAVISSPERRQVSFIDPRPTGEIDDIHRRMMLSDFTRYLPDDILVKVDRASMSVSLEARAPFLDHRVIETAFRIPSAMKFRDGKAKWALRQVLYRYVPPELVERPKMGFGLPVGEWLRGDLRAWGEELIRPSELRGQGFWNVDEIQARWNEHAKGTHNWQYLLWNVLMFQAWLGAQR